MINPQYLIIIQRMNGKVALALHPLQCPNSDYSPASDVHAANNDAIAQSLFVNHAKKLKQNALAQRPRGLLYPVITESLRGKDLSRDCWSRLTSWKRSFGVMTEGRLVMTMLLQRLTLKGLRQMLPRSHLSTRVVQRYRNRQA
jgi:hypothetical protein